MSDYANEMFRRDYEKVIPLLIQYRDREKQVQADQAVKSEYAVLDRVLISRSFTQEKIGGRINAGICQKDDYQKSVWSQACSRWCYSMQRLPL